MLFLNIISKGGLIFLFLVCGCANRSPGVEEKVVAKINNFQLTVGDLKEEVNPLLMKKYSTYSSSKQKDQVLEELIIKEVLLQEAQRLNLDKQKSFMKEIEGYWEQALMKSLISRKLGEFSVRVKVSDQDILEGYNRLKRRVQAELVIFNEKSDALELSKTTLGFTEAKHSLREKIVWESAADWYNFNDLPQKLDDAIFSMRPDQVSLPIEYNNNWIVIRVVNEESQAVGTLAELRPRIINDIIRKKKELLMDNWISGLRKKANVRIYPEVLNMVDLKLTNATPD
jgi:parvulin-like peptidyl-prolyl isomerase